MIRVAHQPWVMLLTAVGLVGCGGQRQPADPVGLERWAGGEAQPMYETAGEIAAMAVQDVQAALLEVKKSATAQQRAALAANDITVLADLITRPVRFADGTVQVPPGTMEAIAAHTDRFGETGRQSRCGG